MQNFKPNHHDIVFECFQSHCHILKELHEFLHMMGAIIIFGENIFMFCFVIIDWSQSQLGWVHIWGGRRENKMSKDESGLSVIEMMCGDSMQLNLLDKVKDDNIYWCLFSLENMMMEASKYLSIGKCKKMGSQKAVVLKPIPKAQQLQC